MKVAMLLHVRAKTRCPAVHRDLAGHPRAHQRIQAIINRRHRNLRHAPLGANENFLSRGMIALLHQDVIDLTALRREAKAARGEPFAQMLIRFFMLDAGHSTGKLSVPFPLVNS